MGGYSATGTGRHLNHSATPARHILTPGIGLPTRFAPGLVVPSPPPHYWNRVGRPKRSVSLVRHWLPNLNFTFRFPQRHLAGPSAENDSQSSTRITCHWPLHTDKPPTCQTRLFASGGGSVRDHGLWFPLGFWGNLSVPVGRNPSARPLPQVVECTSHTPPTERESGISERFNVRTRR